MLDARTSTPRDCSNQSVTVVGRVLFALLPLKKEEHDDWWRRRRLISRLRSYETLSSNNNKRLAQAMSYDVESGPGGAELCIGSPHEITPVLAFMVHVLLSRAWGGGVHAGD